MVRINDTKHRRVFEKHHGRKIKEGYHIHHIDGNHLNNDISNLVEVTPYEHYMLHKEQGDYAACILLAKIAQVDLEEVKQIQRLHGLACANNKVGIHSDEFDHSTHIERLWRESPPGRKPVTNEVEVIKFKTDEEVESFLKSHTDWRRGIPASMKEGLSQSKRRLTSSESKMLAQKRLTENSHNFMIEYQCPHCGKIGKGPMMKRWHFDNCKNKEI